MEGNSIRSNIQKIEINWEKEIIYWGNLYTQKQYIPDLNWRTVCDVIGCRSGLKYGRKCGTKENNKRASELLGIPPKQYAQMLKGAQYKLFIAPKREGKEYYIQKLGFSDKGLDLKKLDLIHNNFDVLEQYRKDGLYNLFPFAMYFGESTKTLKERFGKSKWKKIRQNSFNKNKKIIEAIMKRIRSINDKGYDIEQWLILPSSVFCYEEFFSTDIIARQWVVDVLKKQKRLTKCDKRGIGDLNVLFYDTHEMAYQLGYDFNNKWSYKTMKEKHDEFSKELAAIKYSTTPFDFSFNAMQEHFDPNYPQYKAVLLDSPWAIAYQGKKERHCVATYATYVKKGEYLIYDIQNKNGETESTLGIFVNFHYTQEKGQYYRFEHSQQYKSRNQPCTNEELMFGQKIVDNLNKINYNNLQMVEFKTKNKELTEVT